MKYKIIKYLIAPLLVVGILTIPSCKDTSLNPYISCIVVDATTGAPIPGAKVALYKSPCDVSGAGSRIESGTTDSNGYYKFHKTDDKNCYRIYAMKENYFDDGQNFSTPKIGDPTNTKVRLDPFAILKVHVKSINPFDDNDEFSISEYSDYFGNKIEQLRGRNIDTSFYLLERGNKFNNVNYFYYKNNIEYKKDTMIYCPAFKTTFYEVRY